MEEAMIKPGLIVVFVLFAQVLFAQRHFIGVKGGINWSYAKTNTAFDGHDAARRFQGGLTYRHQFNNGFYLGTDWIYAERGFENGLFTGDLLLDICPFCSRIAIPESDRFIYNYWSLPIKAGFTIGDNIMFFSDVAIVPSRLIHATDLSPYYPDGYGKPDEWDFAAQLEVGGAFRLYSRWAAYGSLSYLHGITSATNNEYFPEENLFHRGANFSFGVTYELKVKTP